MAFTEYGPYWRHIRKLCTLQLLLITLTLLLYTPTWLLCYTPNQIHWLPSSPELSSLSNGYIPMVYGMLRLSLSPDPKLLFNYSFKPHLPQRRRSNPFLQPRSNSKFTLSSSLQASANTAALQQVQQEPRAAETSVLLDVSGMMCGGCVSRVKSVLSRRIERVDSVAGNMLTETAAIKLRPVMEGSDP